MDYPLSFKDLRNERRRQRYATVLTGEGRSRGASCRDTYVPSIGSVNGSVDCNSWESVPVLLPFISPSCSGCELLSDVSLDSVLVNDLPASFISSNVHNNLPRTSSVSLNCHSETGESSSSVSLGSTLEIGQSSASTFELGQSYAASVGLPNVSFCYSCRAKPQTASSVCFGSNFQIGQTSSAFVGHQHG